jgi:Zn-dependent protease with chaperone function
MYTNFIYLIVVLLIFITYRAPEKAAFTGIETALLFVSLSILFIALCRIHFRRLAQQVTGRSTFRLDHQFSNYSLRLSLAAIVLFSLDLYLLNLPVFFAGWAIFQHMPTLLALLFLSLFLCYLIVIWFFAYPAYRDIYGSKFTRNAYIKSNISITVPLLLPWLFISGLADILAALPFAWPRQFLSTTEGEIIYVLFVICGVVILYPLLIQRFWGCKPVETGPVRSRIEAICGKANLRFRNILYWPIYEGRMITAGVMGLFSKFRYILVTRAMLRLLTPEEVDTVIAHEIGHVKKYHMLFYIFLLCGFFILVSMVMAPLYTILTFAMEPVFNFLMDLGLSTSMLYSISLCLNLIILVIIYFRYIFGYFMRNFERQADTFVYTMFNSSAPLIATFEKIAAYSGMPADRPNWHHFSIKERIDFLKQCESDRSRISHHNRKVRTGILLYFLGVMIIGIVGYQLNFGKTGVYIAEHIILQQIDKNPDNPQFYAQLGDLYYRLENFEGVQQAYQKSLELKPDSPYVLNNLAWFYATCREHRYRNPEKALALSQRAAHIKESPEILDTLAESYYVNGMYRKALTVGQRAMALQPENPAHFIEQIEKFKGALERNK